jgi:uncharacterized protein
MSAKSYDYANRQGVKPLTWDEFAELVARLAEKIEAENVDIVLGTARAGLFPATLLSCYLRREMFPVRLTRRVNDTVTFDKPVWRVPVTPDVAGKTVVVVDEIADTGETLALVAAEVRAKGAVRVVTATLVAHSWAQPMPDYVALVSDELVIFPWDSRVLLNGQWQPHPEIVAALALQQNEEL